MFDFSQQNCSKFGWEDANRNFCVVLAKRADLRGNFREYIFFLLTGVSGKKDNGIIRKRSKTVLFTEFCVVFELSRQSKTEAYILLITFYFCYVFDIFTG